jgi:hypothetical protein
MRAPAACAGARHARPARARTLACGAPGKSGRECFSDTPSGRCAVVADTEPFALLVLLTAAAGPSAVLSSQLTERVKLPSPGLVLAGAAQAVKVVPG